MYLSSLKISFAMPLSFFLHISYLPIFWHIWQNLVTFLSFFPELAILLRFRARVSFSMSYRGGDRRARGRNAPAQWKNVLTAYARLEIGERLCKTWLAHFKCRNAKQHRRSRCIAV